MSFDLRSASLGTGAVSYCIDVNNLVPEHEASCMRKVLSFFPGARGCLWRAAGAVTALFTLHSNKGARRSLQEASPVVAAAMDCIFGKDGL